MTDTEIQEPGLIDKASAAASRILGAPVTIAPVRPHGDPYRNVFHVEHADGTLQRLPGTYGHQTVDSVLEVLAGLEALRKS